ncbi:Septum-associated rare lipoprotein A [hydrothermal vent metagenome]|uniref:Septum-associated rare lipoprotein A n=1 Tax=hydrothermal vent metagenome TaxID=652676 RepID=A0A3B1BJ40_9ZZZZ
MHKENSIINRLFVLGLVLLATGCSITPKGDSPPAQPQDISGVPDAIPKSEPRSRYGNPSSYEVMGKRYYVKKTSRGYTERGIASWYGSKFHGRRTSSGETYDMYAMTAAHTTLPLPTYARVTNLQNGRSIVVKINDRGPFHDNRIIDLSYTGANKLGIIKDGTGLVEVTALDPGQPIAPPRKAAKTAATSATSIYIQVGAFSSRFNADRLAQRITHSLGSVIRVKQHFGAGGDLFRVQVGPLASVELADSMTSQLEQIGISDLHVIVD